MGIWEQEYMGTFASPTKEEQRALELWCWYYVTCEDYDRTVCTGGMRGESAMPGLPYERVLINANARRVREVIDRTAEQEGIPASVFKAAQDSACQMRLDDARRIAKL